MPLFLGRLASANRAAYLAALCLVAIQVGIGIVMKTAQSSGGYRFSPTASVAISEFFKWLLSVAFFAWECTIRAQQGTPPKSETRGYSVIPRDDHEFDDIDVVGATKPNRPARLTIRLYWQYIRSEITARTRWELCNLALLYVLVNNTIFACYNEADPGTIALVKSSGTVITALVMIGTIGASVSRMQWLAIALQLCGLLVTQYTPGSGTTYTPFTYMLIMFHVFLGALAGVYNQVLLQRESCSMHANNMTLYAAGTLFNLVGHLLVRLVSPEEPTFFHGFDRLGAILVIVSNVFVGLAITAVYKYADAVIKCFATALATGILLYVSTILFHTHLGFLAVPGTLLVFIASWIYIRNPPPPRPAESKSAGRCSSSFAATMGRWPKTSVLGAFLQTMLVVILLWVPDITLREEDDDGSHSVLLDSPFRNTVAFVRWNHAIPERIPAIMKYDPFFHTMHLSMRDSVKSEPENFLNMTHDQHVNTGHPQEPVAKTMKLILEHEPDVDGMLFFHFDAWVTPMEFMGMDMTRMAIPMDGGPNFRCYETIPTDKWEHAQQEDLFTAVGRAVRLQPPELPDDGEVVPSPRRYSKEKRAGCRGWSDIYYIPRRFFADYIFLVERVFHDTFHEMSVATMMHMIDRTRSRTPFTSFIDPMPCWGSCCSKNPSEDALLWHRCGHKLDLRSDRAKLHWDRIDAAAFQVNRTNSGGVNGTTARDILV
ncbi:CMP-sialic acid transporter [Emericellopsis cladophorae]|uniref:CMP-sialic acid transporter n=1 Tax=Emericellopsis cladophorae TaxID=2686198 RepID=A0A9P9XXH6_9HYPO|nr:CMP-sialic acid transporter [Emericellopsis cladophorae]KAI6779235.1 CMP-sialic acid transporter [Emericellopsis cladophorae]